ANGHDPAAGGDTDDFLVRLVPSVLGEVLETAIVQDSGQDELLRSVEPAELDLGGKDLEGLHVGGPGPLGLLDPDRLLVVEVACGQIPGEAEQRNQRKAAKVGHVVTPLIAVSIRAQPFGRTSQAGKPAALDILVETVPECNRFLFPIFDSVQNTEPD